MRPPTLSVVMPNYNHARFIPDALGAILSQSYLPKEILIIDDGSTDNSFEILEQHRRRAPALIKLYRHEHNLGLMKTLAELTTMATGDFMFAPAFDDRVLPGFFERSMALLNQHPTAGVCSTLSRVMSETGQDQGLVKMPLITLREAFIPPDQAGRILRRHGNWFMGNTTIFSRSSLIDVGGYRPELGPYCDGFASLVITLTNGACFIPEPLAVWRRMDGTFSQRASTNVDGTLAVLVEAERLMTTTFRDRFPSDLVRDLKRQMYFGAAAALMASPQSVSLAQVQRLMPITSRVDRMFYFILRVWPRLGQSVAKPYVSAKQGWRHLWRTFTRRLRYSFPVATRH